jgi:hypothetical protein
MTNFERILTEFAEETRDAARRELGSRTIGKNRTYGVATRALQKSLTFSVKGGSVTFGSPLPYAGFMHWGVNGTQKNHGSPYSYRSKQPPLEPIMQWMRVKPVRLRDKDGRFVEQTESRMRSAAFLIARSIKKKGIKGVKYWTEAFEAMYPRYAQKLAEAKADDIVLELSAKVGNITIKAK